MNLRQAAQQALEALENPNSGLVPHNGEWCSRQSIAITALRAALAEPEQEPFGCDAERYARKLREWREYYKTIFTEHKPQTTHWEGCEAVHPECRKPEPVATKQMLRWVEHLKRLSDDGQHMSIPGLSSGACWELAIELEQFIKNTAPTPRKPVELTNQEIQAVWAKTFEMGSSANTFARAVIAAYEAKQGEQQ